MWPPSMDVRSPGAMRCSRQPAVGRCSKRDTPAQASGRTKDGLVLQLCARPDDRVNAYSGVHTLSLHWGTRQTTAGTSAEVEGSHRVHARKDPSRVLQTVTVVGLVACVRSVCGAHERYRATIEPYSPPGSVARCRSTSYAGIRTSPGTLLVGSAQAPAFERVDENHAFDHLFSLVALIGQASFVAFVLRGPNRSPADVRSDDRPLG